MGHVMTWAFVLDAIEDGTTRLLVRVRVRAGARVFWIAVVGGEVPRERDPLCHAAEAVNGHCQTG
jgi:hypothetical protein